MYMYILSVLLKKNAVFEMHVIYGTKFYVIAFFSPFCRFFNRKLDIYCGFIPQVIFLISIFGYLVCEIFIKWIIFTVKDAPTAPNLLIGTACLLISLVFL